MDNTSPIAQQRVYKRRNSGREWDKDDLVLLGMLMRDNFSMKHMKQILGRSEYAIKHAFRNTMYHHLLDHSPEDVATSYNLTTKQLTTNIVPVKYQVPLPSLSAVMEDDDTEDEEAEDEEAEDEEAEDEDSCNMGNQYAMALGMLMAMCVCGLGYYTNTLCREWSALTMSS